jgi:hypothetical protein
MSRLRFSLLPALLLCLLAPTLVACGTPDVSGLSAHQLLAKAKTQVKTQPNMTVKGKITDGGSEITIDLSYVGKDAAGTVAINGNELDLLTVGGKSWFKASDAFWKAQTPANADQIIALVKGRWIVADPSATQLQQLTALTQRSFITDQLLSPSGKVTKGAKKTVAGVACVAVKSSDGILWLATDDARPIRIESTTGSKASSGQVDFTYGKAAKPKAPAASDTVDLNNLGG